MEDTGGTPLTRRTELLREALDRRVAILDGPQIAMRVFLGGHRSLSQALVATAAEAVDGTGHNNESHRRTLRGGVDSEPVGPSSITAPFDEPTLDVLFGPMEATVALRTPMPVDGDLPGVAIKSARTAHLTGRRGRDCALGYSRHQGRRRRVGLEAEDRFRHTYLLGQTGTGKSTLMANMILQDLRRGRGVAVLDPHGNLVESVLERMPEERSGDVVLFDVTDVERPIPFNILSVDADTPYEYRQQRDLVIDELHRYVHHHFSPDMVGPMFETHLRGTLGLLMGSRPPRGRRAPNLMLLNGVYSNESLRERLVEECRGEDVLLDEFIRQVDGSPSDWSFSGMASYVTSKFNRFIYDRTLRNILCQRDILDVESIVDEGKVLLVNLGKGRFGDVAAGLLAGQIVARIRRAVMRQGTGGRPFYLYADEFQLFADAHFAEMLAEARKFGLALTVAHQFTDQLPEEALHSVLGNVGTKIFFRVGPRDASTVAPLLHPRFDEHDVVSLPNYRSYVQSAGSLGQLPFSLDTLPLHGEARPQRAYELRSFSRNKYGRPRQLVEQEILDTWNA
ncbi:MAG: type IV secretory system conjugative DNA transfer family protein, partial [Persicimonas sp.]